MTEMRGQAEIGTPELAYQRGDDAHSVNGERLSFADRRR